MTDQHQRIAAVNGAVGESRRRFLKTAVAAGGTLTVGGVLIGGLPRLAASAASPSQDARILNFALLLEQLQAAFYDEAVARGALQGELRQFARIVGGHERAHVGFLEQTLGAKARRAPRFEFGEATAGRDEFVASAIALEDATVGAYNGQATNLTSGALGAAARIVSVEARHAAWIRDIAGKPPAADATDAPLGEAQVQAAVRKTGFVKS